MYEFVSINILLFASYMYACVILYKCDRICGLNLWFIDTPAFLLKRSNGPMCGCVLIWNDGDPNWGVKLTIFDAMQHSQSLHLYLKWMGTTSKASVVQWLTNILTWFQACTYYSIEVIHNWNEVVPTANWSLLSDPVSQITITYTCMCTGCEGTYSWTSRVATHQPVLPCLVHCSVDGKVYYNCWLNLAVYSLWEFVAVVQKRMVSALL